MQTIQRRRKRRAMMFCSTRATAQIPKTSRIHGVVAASFTAPKITSTNNRHGLSNGGGIDTLAGCDVTAASHMAEDCTDRRRRSTGARIAWVFHLYRARRGRISLVATRGATGDTIP